MKSKKTNYGGIIFAALFLCFVITVITVSILSKRTVLSTSMKCGNTAGNLYNYGLFCEDGDRIYFSNINDQGALYSMKKDYSDFKKISSDYVRYINADENYIYYSRNNNLKDKASRSIFIFYSNGIYRMSKSGHNLKMLWNKPIGTMVLYRNKIYYQKYVEGSKLSISSVGIDGEGDKEIYSDDSQAVSIDSGKLYFAGIRSDKNLHSISLDSSSNRIEAEGSFYNPIVNGNYIYYIDSGNKYRLYRADYNGDNRKILVNERIASYNFSEDFRYLYYQKDGSEDNGLCVMDMNDGSIITIKKGDFKWLNTVGTDCFFTDFDGSQMYVYSPNKGISIFDPPVIND